ncbi:PHP domain-containing protein [Bacillus mycoides]|uniref:Polymerase/histidinol phosphatase N-terminal domain-containing protein n=1 Tax=Bacillus mycoides TaxID=1405 RepID=A0A1S9T121_BACMY|nr:PHP domain-containing protein [Bacillus mycoides]OOR03667.1 hypothetical protein BW900_25885 [Bacillus mycoides]
MCFEEIKFWERYNQVTIKQIENLLKEDKQTYLVDLHIHSDCSADGLQTVQEVIDRAVEKNFSIISITDHDSVAAYREVREIIKAYRLAGKSLPIIVTGIEFTVRYDEYGDMCHILKYGINPYNQILGSAIQRNKDAFWTRAHQQFERMKTNVALCYFASQYNINFSINEYKKYLENCKVSIPEYPSLIAYIYQKLAPYNIKLIEIVKQLEHDIEIDNCIERKKKRIYAVERFKKKYQGQLSNTEFPSRLLSPLLAPRGIDDDDYPNYPSSGSLSVRNYGQININELPNEGITVFAHPNGDKLQLMNNCLNIGGHLAALELNAANRHAHVKDIKDKSVELELFLTKGSDNHGLHYKAYEDMSFYEISKKELTFFLNELKKIYKS